MDFDVSSNFQQMMRFLLRIFQSVISWLDGIKVLPNVSLLSLSIAFTITGLLFTVLFGVVRNGVNLDVRSDRRRSDPRRRGDSNE